jgi:hypothetical protein
MSGFDQDRKLRALEQYWQRRRGANPLPARRDIDPVDMRPWLGNVALVQVVDGGRDFVFRLYGAELAHIFGRDMTGQSARSFPPHHVEIITGPYREVVRAAAPRYTAHILNIGDRRYAAWERVILPLADKAGAAAVGLLLIGLYRTLIADLPAYRASLQDHQVAAAVTYEADGAF